MLTTPLALDAGHAAGLTPPATAALAYRLARGRWPWSRSLPDWPRPLRDRVRRELRQAGMTRGLVPHLPTIRAAAEVYRAVGGVRR